MEYGTSYCGEWVSGGNMERYIVYVCGGCVVWYTINIDNTIDGESFSMTFPDE